MKKTPDAENIDIRAEKIAGAHNKILGILEKEFPDLKDGGIDDVLMCLEICLSSMIVRFLGANELEADTFCLNVKKNIKQVKDYVREAMKSDQ